jgi:flagellar motor switch protein FliN/FliY
MIEREAIERAVTVIAEACARVLGTLGGSPTRAEQIEVLDVEADPFASLERPVVTARVPFVGVVEGVNLFLIAPDQAMRLVSTMAGGYELPDELGEIELSGVAEAMNQMMGGACSALADELSIDADIAPPEVFLLQAGDDVTDVIEGAAHIARFRLVSDEHSATIMQIIPDAFAASLAAAVDSASMMREVVDSSRPTVGAATDDATFSAVERTARISAESAASVLSALLGVESTATLPAIEVNPSDPFQKLEFPVIAVEVAYVSGVTGANLFVLSPAQAAHLAAIMMGLTEPMGDGLSEIELSAVSEAMNQMMGAATNIMADTLKMAIEVSPPSCTVVEDVQAAAAIFKESAYCARFRLIAGAFDADVMQLVSPAFAEHLRDAFATAEAANLVVAEPAAVADAPAAPAPVTGWEDVAAPAAHDDSGLLTNVKVRLSAELGRARMPVGKVANLPNGAVVKLDRSPADALDVLINGTPFAQARLVLVDGEYAVQIVSLSPLELAA